RRGDAGSEREVVAEGADVVLHHELVRPSDVVRGQGDTVLPLGARADRVRPGESVGAVTPLGHDAGNGGEVLGRVLNPEVIVQTQELVLAAVYRLDGIDGVQVLQRSHRVRKVRSTGGR